VWRRTGGCAWVLEDAKIHRLLVRLDAPGDGVSCRDVDPANEVRLGGLAVLDIMDSICTLLWTSMFSIPAMIVTRCSLLWVQAYVEFLRGVLNAAGRKALIVRQEKATVDLNS
jgi:hypothetical protein